jgi:GTP-binding protein SAR1
MFGAFRVFFSSLFNFFGFQLDEIPLNLVLVGLDNAGKTTLQYKLKYGKIVPFAPTQKANEVTVEVGKTKIRAWDLGGHKAVRRTWKSYSAAADAIIFLVDAVEEKRFEEARDELHALLNTKEFVDLPVAILANKQDCEGVRRAEEIGEVLELNKLGHAKVEIFECSVVNGSGYGEAIHWAIKQMKNKE